MLVPPPPQTPPARRRNNSGSFSHNNNNNSSSSNASYEHSRSPPSIVRPEDDDDDDDDRRSARRSGAPADAAVDNSACEFTSIQSHTRSVPRIILFHALSIFTLGALPILAIRYPWIRAAIAFAPARTFREADVVLVRSRDGNTEIAEVRRVVAVMGLDEAGGFSVGPNRRMQAYGAVENHATEERQRVFAYFEYRKHRYVYREGTMSFLKMTSKLKAAYSYIHSLRGGLAESEAEAVLVRHGPNVIEIEPTPASKMVADKLAHPFYLFQIASVLIWITEMYYVYSIVILITSAASIAYEISAAKKNENALRELASAALPATVRSSVTSLDIKVEPKTLAIRDGEIRSVPITQLVVGDAVIIDSAGPAVADMVIVQGGVVVDESSLTGEAVPVFKFPLPLVEGRGTGGVATPAGYSAERNKGSTVFGGSRILEIKGGRHVLDRDEGEAMVIGIVTATGFNSTRGELFRSILYPNQIDFKFYRDSFKFIGALSAVAAIAFINRVINGLYNDFHFLWVIITSLDLITIAVPPALPLVLTVGIGMALQRLKKKNIFCISPDRINFAGRIDVFCWDKTGTLTTSKLSWAGLDRCTQGRQSGFSSRLLSPDDPLAINIELECAVAACHCLNDLGGELLGPPLDVELFAASRWTLCQNEHETLSINGAILPVLATISPRDLNRRSSMTQMTPASAPAHGAQQPLKILKRYEFDAQLQRSSCVYTLESGTGELFAAAKGSPESIKRIVDPASLPPEYHELHTDYAARGFYILAVASKVLKENDLLGLRRERVERGMKFLGFVMLRNPVKGESESVVGVLKGAGVKSVIITGDGSMTAVSVARELRMCGNVLLVDVFEHGLGFQHLFAPRDLTIPRSASAPDMSNESSAMLGEGADDSAGERNDDDDEESAGNAEDEDLSDTAPVIRRVVPNIRRGSAARVRTVPIGIKAKRAAISSSIDSVSQSIARTTTMALADSFPLEELGNTISVLDRGGVAYAVDVAITGAALDQLVGGRADDAFLDWLVSRAVIFARMKPNHKTWVVERMIRQGRYVGMCGDGANDTGALKAAHVGLALSDAEASIVAPFTSARRNLMDVVRLVSEGRCALDTSFIAFKYMFMYPIIQLAMTATLYQLGSGLSNNQFLFDDMVIVLVLAILMLRALPARYLVPTRPTDNLFSPLVIASILGQVVISIGFFVANIESAYDQTWFCTVAKATEALNQTTWLPLNSSAPYNVSYPCYYVNPVDDFNGATLIATDENTSIWLFSHIQLAILSLTFCLSSPYRRPAWTNFAFVAYFVLIMCVLTAMLLVTEGNPGFELMSWAFSVREGVPKDYRVGALFLATCNLAASLAWERIVVGVLVKRWVHKREDAARERDRVRMSAMAGVGGGSAESNGVSSAGVAEPGITQRLLHRLGVRLDMAAAMRAATSIGNTVQGRSRSGSTWGPAEQLV